MDEQILENETEPQLENEENQGKPEKKEKKQRREYLLLNMV